MKPRTIILILGSVLLFFLLLKACVSTVNNSVNSAFNGVFKDKDALFKNTDFSTGDYAIILDDESPAILINNIEILEKNKNKISTDISWMTYLPGEGRGPVGIRLYKNKKLIHARLARKFKTFQVGELRAFGKSLERKYIYEPRKIYLKQKDSLQNLPDVYIDRLTEVDSNGYEYRFTLRFPSLLVSEKDTIFDANAYGQELANRTRDRLRIFDEFRTGNNATDGSMTPPMLRTKVEGSDRYLEDPETGKYVTLDGYILYSYRLIFFGTRACYEKIQKQNFENSFKREGLTEQEIKFLIREKIGPDTKEIKLSEIYQTTVGGFELGSLYENKYELKYFQLRPN